MNRRVSGGVFRRSAARWHARVPGAGATRLAGAVPAGLCVAALLAQALPASAQDVRKLLTTPERTGYVETSRYADVLAFVQRVADASPLVQLDTMGYTFEGRAIP